ncbi:hypothetical protein [Lutibaculum baratangense]|uniref:Uncharacterized protein n=1 Tax=Lutibaculum baratangense AMV1 TaxID=631454 RepID=V4T8L9_9HYPH|nr:hypothetical protein [Lutibaculum baratangense]ESR22888.1 hypothetical protein N177_4025 [Lutibaculum baratangense AMV1]
MRGSVLGYDAGAGVSVVRGEDGRRYAFAPTAWREQRPPRKGDLVDFEPAGARAEMVFLLTPPKDKERAGPDQGSLLARASRQPTVRALLDRPVILAALLVLLAGLAGVYRMGDESVSLYQVPDVIAGFARAFDALGADAGRGADGTVLALRALAVVLLALYAVPLAAAGALWRELSGRPSGAWGRYGGLAAMVLPFLLPLIVIVATRLTLPEVDRTGLRLGGGGIAVPPEAFDVLQFYGMGTFLLLFAGLGLWASATGRFNPLAEPRPAAAAGGAPVLRDGPASFGPPSVRKQSETEEASEMVLPSALQRRQQSARMVRDEAEPEEAPVAPAATPARPEARARHEPAPAPPHEPAPAPERASGRDALPSAEEAYSFDEQPKTAAPVEPEDARSFAEEMEDPTLRRYVPSQSYGSQEAEEPSRRAPVQDRRRGQSDDLDELALLADDLRSALEEEMGRGGFGAGSRPVPPAREGERRPRPNPPQRPGRRQGEPGADGEGG